MLMPSYVLKVKEPDTDKPAPKRKKRRERVQEATQISTLQVCIFLKKKSLNTLKFELPLYSLANCLFISTENCRQHEAISAGRHPSGGFSCGIILWLQGSPLAIRLDE